MDIGDLFDAGSDILNAVSDAVESNDFSNLSDTIRQRVGEVGGSAGTRSSANRGYGRFYDSNTKTPTHYSSDRPPYTTTSGDREGRSKTAVHYSSAYNTDGTRNENGTPYRGGQYVEGSGKNLPAPYFNKQQVGKYKGLPQAIIGFGGAALSGLGAIGALLGLAAGGIAGSSAAVTAGITSLIVSGGLTGAFTWLGVSGAKLMDLVKKYYDYGSRLGNAEFFTIEDFARKVGKTPAQLIKELQKMQKKGFLPGAVMDNKQTTMMLTDKAYEQYSAAEKARIARELEEDLNKKEDDALASKTAAASKGDKKKSPEVEAIIREGNAYVREIHRINDQIPESEGMSAKLYQLENVMKRIFTQLDKDPRSASDMRRLMDYYLPTTRKLLNAYVELNEEPEVGENIPKTKREIEEAMDTINEAFEKLLDDLFQDVAWDISTDISVMKTMMEQDGLTENAKMSGEAKTATDRAEEPIPDIRF